MTQRGALLGGRYLLDQVIGRGGMAEVWRGRDTRLERDVAIKRLRVDLASDTTFQARFRREAQSAAGLNHPNIVAVYDTGEERTTASDVAVPYIVMELVEGVTLREVLRDGRKILPERALEFTAGVLDALAYSHRAGIIHRDIKPANVMLTPGGTVKVMDFGIARAVADTSATMTQTAAVIGTAQYLSPEQARGEKVDSRSDIYSVGCLLYELLTSEPLFKGDSPVSVAYQHVRETPVPPSQLDSEITPAMDAVVLKALAKDPRDRYQDASEFREDVLRAMRAEPVHAVAPVEQATQIIANDPMTTTARRAVPPIPAGPVGVDAIADDAEVAQEEQPKRRKGLIALLLVAGLVIAALVAGAFLVMNPRIPQPSQTQVAMVDVPDVVGQNEAAAIRQIENAELVAKVEYKAGTDDNKGQVIEQSPMRTGGQVEKGSTVTIYVSQGSASVTIPTTILNVPYETAKALLEAQGLTSISKKDADPKTEPITAKEGDVLSATPEPGKSVAKDTAITLYVATGKSVVPDLKGLDKEAAQAAAEKAGFRVSFKEVESANGTLGQVYEQSLKAGTQESRGTTITATVAKALTVPDLTGMTRSRAKAAASAAGFSVTFVEVTTTEHTAGVVFKQTPTSGSSTSEMTITAQIAVAPVPSVPASPEVSPTP